MKNYWDYPVVDPSVLKKFLQNGSELDKELDSIPVDNRAARLTLQSLSDELLYVEGLLSVEEIDSDDLDELSFFLLDEDFDEEE